MKRKVIEVSLLPEAINRESANGKPVSRRGHPATLHLWGARRPSAAARAILFSQLVDDPSARPEEFSTEEAQAVERARLHRTIEKMVAWDSFYDTKIFKEARQEILKSTGGNPHAILDPIAGGGTIPLGAERLGLQSIGADLNPVRGIWGQPEDGSVVERAIYDGRYEVEAAAPEAMTDKRREVIEEVVRHIVSPRGPENISIVLEARAENSEGFAETVARTVRENSRVLGLDKSDFEDVEW